MGVFNADKIIKQHISDADLYTYFVGYDLTDGGMSSYRIDSLVKLLINVIPEFALGHHIGLSTPNTEIVATLVSAAKAVYSIDVFQKVRDIYSNGGALGDGVADKYLKRGEFCELILHLLLREYQNTIPLLSKIYFKDSFGSTVHGFDAVHIQESTKTLWLGELKLYTDGELGVKALVGDIKEHFTSDYLNSEFAIVSRKIKVLDNVPEKNKWIELLQEETTLKNKLTNICIPLLCTYESALFSKYDDEPLV